jgi:hypothetical protein
VADRRCGKYGQPREHGKPGQDADVGRGLVEYTGYVQVFCVITSVARSTRPYFTLVAPTEARQPPPSPKSGLRHSVDLHHSGVAPV